MSYFILAISSAAHPLCFQIRLQIRRTVSRNVKSSSELATTGEVTFTDRDVADAKDGYVCCESYVEKKEFRHMSVMEKGIQVRGGYFAVEVICISHSFDAEFLGCT